MVYNEPTDDSEEGYATLAEERRAQRDSNKDVTFKANDYYQRQVNNSNLARRRIIN